MGEKMSGADLLGIINGAALLLVFGLLLRGPFRKFWIVLVYVTWELCATVALTILDVLYKGPAQVNDLALQADVARWYARLYWSTDVLLDLFRFLLVIVLTYRATVEPARRSAMVRILGGVVAVMLVLPFVLFPVSFSPWPHATWFNSTSQLLNFGAAIMNLGLWGALLANRKRDPQLVAVSTGLGVVVTGTAISYGLRHFMPPQARFIPNLFLMLSQLGGWIIWCRAFWPAPARQATSGRAVLSP